jgi:citrate lyase subunit beta / citryl-CoA lyase
MVPRSYLFVPADQPQRFAKALASGADAVIVDLEDAVAPNAKAAARRSLAEWLAGPAEVDRGAVVVRINAVGTDGIDDDIAVCRSAGVEAIMVPKAERTEDLARVAAAAGKPLIALIETALGLDSVRSIAQAPSVARLAFGSIDFQLDMGIAGDGEELLAFRSQIVLASRLAGLPPPVDGVSTAIDDAAAVRDDAKRSRRLGFGAKLCIHPTQVAAVNLAFTPSAEELAWARRVVDAAGGSRGAAVAVDGKMVDKPVLLRAEALLRQAGEAE